MFLYAITFFLAGSEILKQIILYMTMAPADAIWYLPFQLCSMPIYLLPIYLKTRSRVLESFLSDFSILGGIFAFADRTGMHYRLPILTVHSYLWHILLVVLGIYLISQRTEKRDFKEYGKTALLFLFLSACAVVINLCLDGFGEINMFYINPHYPMRQVVFGSIADMIGHSGARLIYLLSILTGGALIHAVARRFPICKEHHRMLP